MADAIQSKADLLTAFAGGAPDSISAQDMRNLLVTLLGDFGGMSFSSTNPPDFNTADGAFKKYDRFAIPQPTSGVAGGITVDVANDKCVVGTAGVFLVQYFVAFGADAEDYTFSVFVNGSELSPLKIDCRATTGGQTDVVQAGAGAPVSLAVDDEVELHVMANGPGVFAMKVHQSHLSLMRIG